MKKIATFLFAVSVLIFSAINMQSCGRNEETTSCFPQVPISVQLNLNLPAYYKLQNVGGWMYIDEQSAGTRGLIVVRTGSGFKVFDRNAPHLCPDVNTTLEVVGDIKIVCPKDKAEWILFSGQPTAIANVAPKTYPYNYDPAGNILSIYY